MLLAAILIGTSVGCRPAEAPERTPSGPASSDRASQAEGGSASSDARAFADAADRELLDLANKVSRAQWVAANFITHDTEALSADAYKTLIAATMRLGKEAKRFDGASLDADTVRRLNLLKLASIPLPAPSDPAKQTELTQLAASLEGMYGRGKYCPPSRPAPSGQRPTASGGQQKAPGTTTATVSEAARGQDCLDINEITQIMAKSRNPRELADVWTGWHAIGPAMKPKYTRFVELGNEGARELGYKNLGALWRSNYDMPADAFAAELDRLWAQVKPLYDALHMHVRASLSKKYGAEVVPAEGPIPAHLLGNLWAQSWGNVYDLVGVTAKGPGYDLDRLLKAKGVDEREMVRYGERFFTSLGFDPLPATFWERSLFTKPRDRDVVCHASAWDIDNDQDLRIKMCIVINGEDFVTIHHELGHNIYQRAYRTLPFIYRGSANDGFHEAIGDAIALSVTPSYLVKVGLLKQAPGPEGDLEFLMRMALDKVAFLPFGLLVDQWRWKVFSGEVPPERYNAAWWELRRKYQNMSEPVARSEADFDPGAKYHVPGNTPYSRYFLAHILQFQFHRAMCRDAGYTGPLHGCSIYDNKAVGAKLAKMLAMGQSKPWPDALEALTGERQMDASAILDYFAPLKKWLDEQNQKLATTN
jgi:peptidyl-dipeptidase A